MNNDTWLQILTILASNLLIMITFFGISVSLHNGMREEIRGVNLEMKDFHGRLCTIEESKKRRWRR